MSVKFKVSPDMVHAAEVAMLQTAIEEGFCDGTVEEIQALPNREHFRLGMERAIQAAAEVYFHQRNSWNNMADYPSDRPILACCTQSYGEIHGIKEHPEGVYCVIQGKPERADVPGDNWFPIMTDTYSVWVWPVLWQEIHVPHLPQAFYNNV